jgi:hypothetical protein
MNLPCRILLSLAVLCTAAFAYSEGGKRTVAGITPPPGYVRVPVREASFAASLRQVELTGQKELLAGDGKTVLCNDEKVDVTVAGPYDNANDTGVDGIIRLWGEYLWSHQSQKSISFPLDNGQQALWNDWRDGLRPKKSGGRFIFTQVTTPSGGYASYQQFCAFVGEEMGALALRRESTIIIYEDSLTVGDLIEAMKKDTESRVGIILDACKDPQGERLFLLGTCGTPSTSLYIVRPYSPVQGLNEWFTLDGARWAIGEGARTDLRRVALDKS